MRVCIITHNVLKGDGQGRVNYELARTLLSRGIQVELLADHVDEDLLEAGATWIRIQPRSQRVNHVKDWKFAHMVDHELRRRKNHDLALQGLGSEPPLHLAVLGNLRGSSYPALAEQLRLCGRVRFLGFRQDVADIMRAVDLFTLPSRRDSCPLVSLEATWHRASQFLRRTLGAPREIIEDGVDGLLAPYGNPQELAEALNVILADPELVETLGRRAKTRARDFSVEAYSCQISKAIYELHDNAVAPL